MRRRKWAYLALIAPLHHFALVFAATPPALFMRPDILSQMTITVPLFCLIIWWVVPFSLRKLGLIQETSNVTAIGLLCAFFALICLAASIAATYAGITTILEATILFALCIIIGHSVLLAKLTLNEPSEP